MFVQPLAVPFEERYQEYRDAIKLHFDEVKRKEHDSFLKSFDERMQKQKPLSSADKLKRFIEKAKADIDNLIRELDLELIKDQHILNYIARTAVKETADLDANYKKNPNKTINAIVGNVLKRYPNKIDGAVIKSIIVNIIENKPSP